MNLDTEISRRFSNDHEPGDISHVPANPRTPEASAQNCLAENLIQNSPVAVFVLDSRHRVVFWNESCEKLTGVPAHQVIGTSDHWKGFYDHPRPCLSDIVLDNRKDECSTYYNDFGASVLHSNGLHAEGWYENLGGSRRYILFDAAPIYDDTGKIFAVLETLQDITEKKLLEEERERLIQELHETLERNKVLQGLIPICSCCKKIRDDKGFWNNLESYIEANSVAEFSHSVCPECEGGLFSQENPVFR